MLIDELHQGVWNPNVKHIMTESKYASILEYTKHAMFAVTLVTKQLKWVIAVVDSTKGLTGSASVQLPHYNEVEPMELGAMAVSLNQIGKVAGPADPAKSKTRCYGCQGYSHRARERPSSQAVAKVPPPARTRAVRSE